MYVCMYVCMYVFEQVSKFDPIESILDGRRGEAPRWGEGEGEGRHQDGEKSEGEGRHSRR